MMNYIRRLFGWHEQEAAAVEHDPVVRHRPVIDWREYLNAQTFKGRGAPVTSAGTVAMDSCSTGGTVFDVGAQVGLTPQQANWYASQSFIGWQMCATLAQNWLIDKACTMPAEDASRNGYRITANDGKGGLSPEIEDALRNIDKTMKVGKNLVEAERFCRVFGFRVVLFDVDLGSEEANREFYEAKFNPDAIRPGTYKGISQIDPYWMTPLLDTDAASNPASRHFYEPTWWQVSGRRYHRSHLVVIRYSEPADVLKPAYYYGGIPLTQLIAERVFAAERTANEAPQLAMTKRVRVMKTDMANAIANPELFQAAVGMATETLDNYAIWAINNEDEYQQFDVSLSDLDTIIMTQYQLVAAVAKVPATKLMGTSPKGFNATGEFEESSYHEELKNIQAHRLQPIVERHHLLAMRSYVAPEFGMSPVETSVVWEPLSIPSAKELAEIRQINAQADATYMQGAVSPDEVREKIAADPYSGYNNLVIYAEEDPTDEG